MVQASTRTNPFPGLRPFELDEEHLFFGREGQADELLVRLNRTRFLGVVGTSGSGKSSLVRAGLLPSLYSGFLSDASSGWRVAILRPGSSPIRNLAEALNDLEVFGVEPASDDAIIRTALTESTLRRGALGLVEVTRQARMETHENLLVVVDQFEEIFRFKQQAKSLEAENEAAAFVKLLLSAAKQREIPIFVVLTMRSDFLGDCAQFRDLPEALNESQYLIPRLTRDQLRRAIEGPVAVGGASITPQLVNRLLNDVGDNPDQLPILQHALMRTWDYWQSCGELGAPIDLKHYEAIGSMKNALSLHADEIYAALPDEQSRDIAKIIFQCLTDRVTDNRDVRRPTALDEIQAVVDTELDEIVAVIEEFRKPRCSFLMPPRGIVLHSDSVIDISHESLMRNWERLQQWMEEEAESARIYQRLAESAILFQSQQTGPLRDPELATALDWKKSKRLNAAWAYRYSSNLDQVIYYLDSSVITKEDEAKGSQTYLRLAESAALNTTGDAGLLQDPELSVALNWRDEFQPTATWANRLAPNFEEAMTYLDASLDARNAEIHKEEKVRKQKLNGLRAFSVVLSSLLLLSGGMGVYAFQQSVFANKALTNFRAVQAEAERALAIVQESALNSELVAMAASSEAFFVSDKALDALLTALEAARIIENSDSRLRSSTRYQVLSSLRQATNTRDSFTMKDAQSFSFSPDARAVAIGNKDGTIEVWSVTGQKQIDFGSHGGVIWSVVFSPDMTSLVTSSSDKTVKIWSLEGELLSTLEGHQGRVLSTAISPDGSTLATASEDGTVKLWDFFGHELQTLQEHQDSVLSVSFSPDARTLASTSSDGTIRLWSRNGQLLQTLSSDLGGINSAVFSPDGQIIVSANASSSISIWSREGEPLQTLQRDAEGVRGIAFSPDGQVIATAGGSGVIELLSLDGNLIGSLRGHESQVTTVGFSPDGQSLASIDRNGQFILWNLDLDFLIARACDQLKEYLDSPTTLAEDKALCILPPS